MEIDQAIKNAAAVIAIMSPEARNSEYVTYEWAFAWGHGTKVLPIMLRQTTLHPRLATLQYLDFTNRIARPWGRLFKTLHRTSSGEGGSNRISAQTRLAVTCTLASQHLAIDHHRRIELAVEAGEHVPRGRDRHADRGFLAEAAVVGGEDDVVEASRGGPRGGLLVEGVEGGAG